MFNFDTLKNYFFRPTKKVLYKKVLLLKVDSIERGRTVISHLFPWNDQENFGTSRFSNYW